MARKKVTPGSVQPSTSAPVLQTPLNPAGNEHHIHSTSINDHNDDSDDDHSSHSHNSGIAHSHQHHHKHNEDGHSHSHNGGHHGHSHNTNKLKRSSSSSSPRMMGMSSSSHSNTALSNSGQLGGITATSMNGIAGACIHATAPPTCEHTECMTETDIKRQHSRRLLIVVSCLCAFFMCVELVGGYLSNSLAIMSDAAHLLSDLVSFMISLFSITVATRRPTSSMSFGYHRAEIIGALGSVALIWVLTVVLIWESIQRIANPEPINGKLMFIVAFIGALVNVSMGTVLMVSGHGHSHGLGGGHNHSHGGDDDDHAHGDHDHDEEHGHSHSHGGHGHNDESHSLLDKHTTTQKKKGFIDGLLKSDNINVRAAFIHVLGDLVQSIGVMISALIVWIFPHFTIADPICTLLFSIIVVITTVRILKQGLQVLMEGTPENVEPLYVIQSLETIPGVIAVHDLHIWSLSMDSTALSVHILTSASSSSNNDNDNTNSSSNILSQANYILSTQFNIKHTTIQIEIEDVDSCHPQSLTASQCKHETLSLSGSTGSHNNTIEYSPSSGLNQRHVQQHDPLYVSSYQNEY